MGQVSPRFLMLFVSHFMGKAFRKINKPQLVNSVNEKGCLVTIEFSVNETQWKVERGIKPNVFKIYRDGKELDQKANVALTNRSGWNRLF